jgi:hypothetical protein
MMVFAPGHYSKKWGKWFVDEWMWFDHGYPSLPQIRNATTAHVWLCRRSSLVSVEHKGPFARLSS